jgi:hypothetical protein
MRQNRRVTVLAERIGAQRDARIAKDAVAADVIRIRACVDDEANRARRDGLDRLQDLVGHIGGPAVDQNEAVRAHVHDHVPAGTKNRVDVRSDLNRLEARRRVARPGRILLRGPRRGGRQQHHDKRKESNRGAAHEGRHGGD